MRRLLWLITLPILFTSFSSGQSMEEETDFIQSIFGMEKKAAMAAFIEQGGENNDAFWELYDEYEVQRKALGKDRIDLMGRYVEQYGDMDEETLNDLMKEIISQKKSLDQLIDKYYKKILKQSGPVVAAQFWQFENYVLGAIRMLILENIPFIGELD